MLILNCTNAINNHRMNVFDLADVLGTYPRLFKHPTFPNFLQEINKNYCDILKNQYIISALLNIYAPELNIVIDDDLLNNNNNSNNQEESLIAEDIDYAATFKEDDMEYIDPQTKDQHQSLLSQIYQLQNNLVEYKKQIHYWGEVCTYQSKENVEFVADPEADPLGPSTHSAMQLHFYQNEEKKTQAELNRLEQTVQNLLDQNQKSLKDYYDQLSQKEKHIKDQQEQIKKQKYEQEQKAKEKTKLLLEKILLEQKNKSNLPVNYIKLILDQLQIDVNHILTHAEIIDTLVSLAKIDILLTQEYNKLSDNVNEAQKLYNIFYDNNMASAISSNMNLLSAHYDDIHNDYSKLLYEYEQMTQSITDNPIPKIVDELTIRFSNATNMEIVNNIINFCVVNYKTHIVHSLSSFDIIQDHYQLGLSLDAVKNIDVNSDLFYQIVKSFIEKVLMLEGSDLTVNKGKGIIALQLNIIHSKSKYLNNLSQYIRYKIVEILSYM